MSWLLLQEAAAIRADTQALHAEIKALSHQLTSLRAEVASPCMIPPTYISNFAQSLSQQAALFI